MTTRRVPEDRDLTGAELLARVVELCHERKAEDVVVLDVRELVEYMDAMVICTGRSPRQNRAIAEHTATQLKRENRILPLSRSGGDAGSWICVDFVDVVLHVFEPEARAHYDLELLWADAVRTEHESPTPTDRGLEAELEADYGEDEPAFDADTEEAFFTADGETSAEAAESTEETEIEKA